MERNSEFFIEEYNKLDNEEIEMHLFNEMVYIKYGYDFREYSKAHIMRRIKHRLEIEPDLDNISDFTHKVLWDEEFFKKIITDFSINVTEMFRDPEFYKAIRKQVIPILKTYPYLKVWHAGCSTGEEVYSMAILLKEEGLLERTQIYATDFNDVVLKKAKDGIYSTDFILQYEKNYRLSGGLNELSDYYNEAYNTVIFSKELKDKILFSNHNLVTDSVFGEMNLILCRNVLIYFERGLQNKVFNLFNDSLRHGGVLGIGSKETLQFADVFKNFVTINREEKIYKKST